MIARIRTCSWCHEANECPRGELVWCFNCGHRADVPRLLCNCMRCLQVRAEGVITAKALANVRTRPN